MMPAADPCVPSLRAVFMIIVTLVIQTLLVNIWMYARPPALLLRRARPASRSPHVLTCRKCTTLSRAARFYAKAVNCCAELRLMLDSGPDGGACPPVGPCREFVGNCGDLAAQFADVPVLPDFPDGLADYVCTGAPPACDTPACMRRAHIFASIPSVVVAITPVIISALRLTNSIPRRGEAGGQLHRGPHQVR